MIMESVRTRLAGQEGSILRGAGVVLGIYLLVMIVLGIYWSFTPAQFDAATSVNQAAQLAAASSSSAPTPVSKYSQLLAVLEEMSKDIRPTYSGSKSSAERLKRSIVHARILVREVLVEVEKASKQ